MGNSNFTQQLSEEIFRDGRVESPPKEKRKVNEQNKTILEKPSSEKPLRNSNNNLECSNANDVIIALRNMNKFYFKVTLTTLNLSSNSIGPQGGILIAEALKLNSTLTSLNLSYNSLGKEYPIDVDSKVDNISGALKLNSTLKVLDLSNNSIDSESPPFLFTIGTEYICGIANALTLNTTLTDLNISSNPIGPKGALFISEALNVNSSLLTLNLSSSSLGKEGIICITNTLKLNSTLNNLNFSTNSIGLEGSLYIAEALKFNNTITSLDLSCNSFKSMGILNIVDALKLNSTINTLNLSFNSIESEGAISIGDYLKLNSTLTSLNLSSNLIGCEGVISITDALKLNLTLIDLDFSSNNIGFDGASSFNSALKDNTTINTLDLSFCSLFKEQNQSSELLNQFGLIVLNRKKIQSKLNIKLENNHQESLDKIVIQLEKEEKEKIIRNRKEKILKPPMYCVVNLENISSFNNYFNNTKSDNNINPTIVLIGSNGVGKSSFGNWLFNFGLPGIKADNFIDVKENNYERINMINDKQRPFITSSDTGNSTKCCTEKVELFSFSNFNIIDTPGLNDPNDFENMYRLTQFLLLINNISAIILCLPYNLKFDDPTIDTIKYYEKLFKPIFRTKQVIIVFTKVDNEDYLIAKEEEEWEESIAIKLSQLNKKFTCDFSVGFAFNTIYEKEEVSREMIDKKSDNLLGLSMRNRDMILAIINSYKPFSEFQLLFSLPPVVERNRINMLEASKIICLNILEVLGEEENKDKIEVLNKLNNYSLELTRNENEKRRIEDTISQLSSIQVTDSQFFYGDEIFNFSFSPITVIEMNCISDKFECKHQAHNCQIKFIKKSFKAQIEINRDMIAIYQEDGKRWFARVWLEYEGEITNSKSIEDYNMKLKEINYFLHDITVDIAELKNTKELLDIYEKEIEKQSFLSIELFSIEEISNLRKFYNIK